MLHKTTDVPIIVTLITHKHASHSFLKDVIGAKLDCSESVIKIRMIQKMRRIPEKNAATS